MLVTLSGIVTDVKPVQSRKAESSMIVTPSGMTSVEGILEPSEKPFRIMPPSYVYSTSNRPFHTA